jgi:hypothetical protein
MAKFVTLILAGLGLLAYLNVPSMFATRFMVYPSVISHRISLTPETLLHVAQQAKISSSNALFEWVET